MPFSTLKQTTETPFGIFFLVFTKGVFMQKRHLLSAILTLAVASNASAAGYQLQEYSVTKFC